MCPRTLPPEEVAAQFGLEFFDGTGERRLTDMTPLGGPAEVQCLGDREEVANLVHFHCGDLVKFECC